MQNDYLSNTVNDPNISSPVTSVEEDEIDLKEIIAKIWRKKWFILAVTGLFLILGILIAFNSPVSYTASCTIVPQSGEKTSGGNLGGLAAMAGINLGGATSGETLAPSTYPEILKNVAFCKEIMRTYVSPVKLKGQQVTLLEYYTNPEFEQKSFLGTVTKYTIGLPGVIFSKKKSDNNSPQNSTSEEGIQVLSKKELDAYNAIQSSVQINENTKSGYVSLSYSFPDPIGAAQVTNELRKLLEQYVIRYKLDKVQQDLEFVEKNYAIAKQDYQSKQLRLAAFQDANRDLVSAIAATTERKLSTEYDMSFAVYQELAKQREQARIAVKETKPVLTVIKPVVVPTEKSAPKRGMIMAVFGFLGLILSIGWVLVQPFIKDLMAELKKEDLVDEK